MPHRLHKEKFSYTGTHEKHRTTFSGDIELYLYLDPATSNFYFRPEDIEKATGIKNNNVFGNCPSRELAIKQMQWLLAENRKETRMLLITVGVPSDIYLNEVLTLKERNQRTEGRYNSYNDYPRRKKMFSKMYNPDNGMAVSFERWVKLEANGVVRWAQADNDWSIEKSSTFDGSNHSLQDAIEWSPEIESFLLQVQEGIREMSRKVIKFFDVKDAKQLEERIKTNVKLLN